eukprot:TRINITY_DN2268_c0_g4_i1.p1 TRINITY_DN2268_c0_g4~~TRINITY_DN2268_c0_g4_i1.p1  ORF type:complete len:264 (+),score=33.60 TRINITY_DN2268_c0_g4_i1:74-865(+)
MVKRQRLDSEAPQQEEHEHDSEENDSEEFEVDIDFNDVSEEDFHGIKALFNGYVDNLNEFPLSDLVDAIVGQVSVGTVIKSGDEAPIGIITLLNIDQHKERQFWKTISPLLPMDEIIAKFGDEKKLGFLINERLLNCPPEVSTAALQNLVDDLDWAQKNEETQELKDSFKVKGIIYSTLVCGQPSNTQQTNGVPAKNRKNRLGKGNQNIIFFKPEDQWLHDVCQGKRMIAGSEGMSLLLMWFDVQRLQEAPEAVNSMLQAQND